MIMFSIFFGFVFATLSVASAGLMLSSLHQTVSDKTSQQTAATISHLNLFLSIMLVIVAMGIFAFAFGSGAINTSIFMISMSLFSILYSCYAYWVEERYIKKFGNTIGIDLK